MSGLKVLVVGASIAGPMSAYWLARAGAQVTVIERFPEPRKGGQNIDIRTAGVTVMRRTPGLEEAVRAKVVKFDGLSLVNDKGYSYGAIKASGNPDQQTLLSEYEIYRGDLAKILVNLTKDNTNVKYIYNEQIKSIHQEQDPEAPIMVEFENGLPRSAYDLVVACDGATSRTRALGMQCGVRDHILPTNAWAAYFSIPKDLLDGSRYGQAFSTAPGRFMALGLNPLVDHDETRAIFQGISPSNDETLRLFRENQKQGTESIKQFVYKFFKGAGWKTAEVLDCMMKSNDFYASEIVQVKPPAIYKGRFVLVGDAGYATGPTGGGTTLAMTGAYVLAGELAKYGSDLHAGLQGYEKTMRPLITEMQKIPPFVFAFMAPQTTWGLWARNFLFSIITRSGLVEVAQRYLAPAFANTDTYPLPDYTWPTKE